MDLIYTLTDSQGNEISYKGYKQQVVPINKANFDYKGVIDGNYTITRRCEISFPDNLGKSVIIYGHRILDIYGNTITESELIGGPYHVSRFDRIIIETGKIEIPLPILELLKISL